jgi:hypothetical protein
MPFGSLGHGFVPDQGFDDPAMGEAAAYDQNADDDSDNSSG